MSNNFQPRVGIIIIGDEILKGVVEEANAAFFIKQLKALGSDLREIVFIPDDVIVIAERVREFSERYDLVCTTGGIGPTHDDVTISGVARAFDVDILVQDGLVEQIRQLVGKDFNDGHRRLARLPDGAELVSAPGLNWPVLKVRNVYVFPGVPRLLHRKFLAIRSVFEGKHYFSSALTVRSRETEICNELDDIVAQHPNVTIGSYPRMEDGTWVSRLTVDGFDQNEVEQARDALAQAFDAFLLSTEPLRRSDDDAS